MNSFLLRFLLSTLLTSCLIVVEATSGGWSYGGGNGISGSSYGSSWGSSSYSKPSSYWSSSSSSSSYSRPHQISRNGYNSRSSSNNGYSHSQNIRPQVIIKPVLIPYAVVPAASSVSSHSHNNVRPSYSPSYSRYAVPPHLPTRYDHYGHYFHPTTSAPQYTTSTTAPTTSTTTSTTPAPPTTTTNASVPTTTSALPAVFNPTLDCGVGVVGLRRYRHAQSCDRYWQCSPLTTNPNGLPASQPLATLTLCPRGTTFDLDYMICLPGGRCSVPSVPGLTAVAAASSVDSSADAASTAP